MSLNLETVVSNLRAQSELLPLTDREQRILQLIAKGFVSKQIGAELGISKFTVDNIRVGIMDKLRAETPCHMVFIACKRGLI